ncbi:hypothetical protein F2P47_00890 [Parvibaculum sedimenti]|uniref:Uncharacterized protein n=1 Tax=Parvibaculum sedimenti TaxID=2608632 RepID=A0A6N6VMF2_9HYPH|nr:hypothetical protein [Parvibaculum sedimenti]KAB7742721.1 hypothetical protein F2P47_00890 [Parvibaculum sedimenti]
MSPDIARRTFDAPAPERLALMGLRHIEYTSAWGSHFPYVVYFHFGTAPNFDPARLRVLTQGSFFSVLAPKDDAAMHSGH